MAKNEIIVKGGCVVDGGAVAECVNLRRSDSEQGLEPVGAPRVVALTGRRPVGVDARGRIVTVSDGEIAFLEPDGSVARTVAAEVDADSCSASIGVDGGHIVMTGSGAVVVGDDGSVRRVDDRYPSLRLHPVAVATRSVTLPSRTLKGAYDSRTSRLDGADTSTLTADWLDAYASAMASARACGYMTGFCLAAYRLVDSEGRELFTSPPLLFGTGEGSTSVRRKLSVGAAGTCRVAETTVSYPCYRLNVALGSAPGLNWNRVAAVEILMSKAVYPVDFKCTSESRISVDSATEATLDLGLPGAPLSSSGSLSAMRLERLAGLWGDLAATVVSLSPEEVAAEGGVMVISCFEGDFESYVAALDKAVAPVAASARSDESGLTALLSPPHRFTAATAARNGETIVWGDISAHLSPPFTPEAYATEVAEVPWRGYVAVDFEGGGRLVSDTVALTGCPVRLSSLLCYPHPSARGMEIAVSRGGRRVVRRFRLRPSPDRSMAYWLGDNPDGVDLTTDDDGEAFVVPPASAPVARLPGVVAVASVHDPLRPRSAVVCSSGAVNALTAASRSDTGLNYSHTGFYVFASDGICRLTVGGGITSVNCALIDPRGVARGGPVAVAPARSLAVTADGDLIAVSSSRVSTVARVGPGAKALGYSPSRGELWVAGADGSVTVVDSRGALFRRTDVAALCMASDSTHLYVSDGQCLYDAACEEEPRGGVVVAWRCRFEPGFRPAWLTAALTSSASDLTVDLRADGGNGYGRSLSVVKARLRGQVNHPVVLRVASPLRRCYNVAVSGRVAPDFRLDYLRIYGK